MNRVIKHIMLDLDRQQMRSDVTAHVKQTDNNSREIVLTLRENNEPREVQPNESLRLRLKKHSGKVVYADLPSSTDGKVHVVLTDDMLSSAGIAKADIEISDGETRLSSFVFYLNVEERVVSDDDIEDSDDYGTLQKMIDSVGGVDAAVEKAEAAADRANAAAEAAENTDISALEEAIETVRGDVAGLDTAVGNLKSAVETTQGDVTEIQGTVSGLEGSVGELDSMMDAQVALTQVLQQWIAELRMDVDNTLLKAYPVGSIYLSVSPTNPGTLFGGTWVEWGKGRVAVGVDAGQTEFATVEKTGGEKTHKLTVSELASHDHDVSGRNSSLDQSGTGHHPPLVSDKQYTVAAYTTKVGGDQPHNNLQPYITCYMFKRTA